MIVVKATDPSYLPRHHSSFQEHGFLRGLPVSLTKHGSQSFSTLGQKLIILLHGYRDRMRDVWCSFVFVMPSQNPLPPCLLFVVSALGERPPVPDRDIGMALPEQGDRVLLRLSHHLPT